MAGQSGVVSNLDELIFPEERIFGPDPRQRDLAMYLYQRVAALPLVCPHGHVSPRLPARPRVAAPVFRPASHLRQSG
ncbi:MAG: hypothetical protein ABSE06_19365 [Anaerolineaceae bacterium]